MFSDISLFSNFDQYLIARIIGGIIMGLAILRIFFHIWPLKGSFWDHIKSVRGPLQLLIIGSILFKYGIHAYTP